MFSDERNARIDHYETLDLDGLLALERQSPRNVDLLVSIGRHYLKLRQLDQCHDYYSRRSRLTLTTGGRTFTWATCATPYRAMKRPKLISSAQSN